MQAQVSYRLEKSGHIVELIDAHCHLELFENYKTAISDAYMAGVKSIITAGGSKKSSMSAIKIAEEHNVFAVIGVDPSFSGTDAEFVHELKKIIKSNSKIVGVGEIGLDYKLPKVDKELQKTVFAEQIGIANELEIPIVVHARGAIDDAMAMVEEAKVKKAMFHFFEGSEVQAKHLAEHGYLISIPPLESSRRKKIISALKLDDIVVETDSPVVGKSPIDVIKTVGWIAEIKGLDFKNAAHGVTQNVKRLFSI